jgi:hypothetical protein
MKAYRWSGGIAPLALNLGIYGSECLTTRLRRFTSRYSGTHCTAGWVDPWAGVDVLEKRKISYPYPDSNPRPSSQLRVAIPTMPLWLLSVNVTPVARVLSVRVGFVVDRVVMGDVFFSENCSLHHLSITPPMLLIHVFICSRCCHIFVVGSVVK